LLAKLWPVVMHFHSVHQDASISIHASQNALFAWPSAGEVTSQGQPRPSHHHASQPQQQHQISQPQAMSGPWSNGGRGAGAPPVVDPWGRSFSAGGSGGDDLIHSAMNGSGSWNHGPASSSVHNGWFGGYNRNSQQSQQQADHLISPYVTGLPAEILEQVRIQHKRLLFFLFFFLQNCRF
jgi:hypothetical protein